MRVRVRVRVRVRLRVRVRARARARERVRVYECVCACRCVRAYGCACACVHMDTYDILTHVSVHAFVCVRAWKYCCIYHSSSMHVVHNHSKCTQHADGNC